VQEEDEEEEEEEEAPVTAASGTRRIGGRSPGPLRFGLPFGRKADEEDEEEEEEEEGEEEEEVSEPAGKGPLAALFGGARAPKPAAAGADDARAARQAEADNKFGRRLVLREPPWKSRISTAATLSSTRYIVASLSEL
jgi:hypothetical protein